jgi:non-canonical (house-cleaning) NTP pyrophosphatase
VIVAFLSAFERTNAGLQKVNAEHALSAESGLGEQGYKWLGVAFFALMAYTLYRVAIGKKKNKEPLR